MFAEGPLTELAEQSAGRLDGLLQSFRVCALLCSMCSEAKMAVAPNLTDKVFHSFSLFNELFYLLTYSIFML